MVDFLFQVWLLSFLALGAVNSQSTYSLDLNVDKRLLVHQGGTTGTACLWNFDSNDASVVCRQLGYGQQGTHFTLPHIGIPHTLFNVRCNGTESSIDECGYDTYDQFQMCFIMEDIGIECTGTTSSTVSYGPLVSFAADGRVLAHNINGTGTVCGDMWDDVDAGVLCRQMGFLSGTAMLLPRDPVFNRFYFNVNCLGNETDIQSCQVSDYDISGMCGYFEDAGVVCNGMPTGGHSDVTIGPGGRVFAHTMNGTGTVCGDQWDDSDADVVCRQMGFASGTAIQLPHDYMYNYHIFNVRCFGNESQVQQCPVDETDVFGSCSMYMFGDAGVSCANVTAGPPVSMSFAPDGRVLVHNMNGTGTVCGDMWDDVDAGVLCRQLGFPSGTASLLPRDPVFNRFYFNVNCVGHEIDVQSCPVSNYDIHGTCGYFEDAGVVCDGMPGGGQSDVTIGPGGRVFAHTMNGTGTVCGDQWDDSDADVVCRQMGFASGTAIQLPHDYMYNYHIFNVRCFGNESQVQQCPVDETDVFGSCSNHMFGDAGVSCANVTAGPPVSMSFAPDGRVLVHNMNGTGTVCGDMWDDVDAGVLCRQLGFPSGTASLLPRDPVFNRFYFNVNCVGHEIDVQSCPVSNYDIHGTCGYFEDAGVVCDGMPGGGQSDVTIGPGGRVFAHTMNGTGTVCGDQWDDSDADVVCRQMEFASGTAIQLPHDYMYNYHIFNVRCFGNESQVQQCPVDETDVFGSCSNHMFGDAGVSCANVTAGPPVSMSFAPDGRVLVHNMNGTGTVCGDMWDDVDAGVLCRQLGFPSGTASLLPRDPVFNRFYFNVNCVGHEIDVQSCPVSNYDIHGTCGYFEDAGVVCDGMPGGGQSDVTIGPGGRVFAHTMNGTGTVCGDQWDDSDADVVCRQMGFASGTAIQLPRDYMYNYHIFNVRCFGNESQVQQCPVDETDVFGSCSNHMFGDAGVSCANVTAGPPVSMSFAPDGRVLVHNMNGTGTVCGDMWDDVDAGVLCRQLGFPSGTASLLPRDPVFNRFYFNVNCVGHEIDVQSCPVSNYDIHGTCGYFEDAGVVCDGMPGGGQSDVTIGPGGRVFAHTMNGTGTVCGDQWDDSDADVVCRQMGFASGTAIQLPRDHMYNHHIFNVRCFGNESQVQQCPVDETDVFGSCSNHMFGDAGVSCANVTAGPPVSMSFAPDGRVLVHNMNGTGTVCGDMWDDVDAGVLCRQLGFPSGTASLLPRDPVFNRFYFNVNCVGHEIDVQSCPVSNYDIHGTCGYFEDAGVVCDGMPGGGQSDVTIGPGGRVFAHTMNGTGTVCGDQWDDSDADVVCRQMGFASGTAIQLPRDHMYNHHIFNVRCFGNESQVQQCPVDETDVFGSCSNHMFGDAGVSCANVTAGPPVSMSFAPDGRVLVHNMNGTGTVCGDMWDDVDAGVLCRQLGFPSGTASLLPRDPVFNRFYFNVNCVGHEIDVQSCPVSNYDIHGTCGYFEDAGVVCDGMPGGGQSDVTIGPGGRVFAHTMNGTGTVCGDQWDDSDADVVCRQMGFASGTAIQLPRDHMYNHHIFNVRCFGNESQVQQCPVDETDVFGSCSNHMFGDAGVSCANVTAGPPVSMSFAPDGRVLVHNMNGTGTVCGDMWDDVDAGVLCRQLGFPSGTASLLPRDPVFNRFYFNVNCVGHEIDVQSCPVSNYDIHGTCGYFEDAGVVCDGMPGGGQSDVTIGPGGRVFAHTMNGTGTVCGDQWDDSDADVVCRQMGFASGTAIQLPRDHMYNHHIFNVRCFGNESQVQQCPVDETDVFGSCSNHMFGDAGVSCANVTAGPPVSMSFAPDGRVLVHNMNGTGTVCGDMWDDVDAGVLCRQLGFPSGTASLLPRDPVFNRFYFNVNCVGHEIDVQSCPVSNYDIHGTCGYFEDAGVVCDGMPGGGQSDVTIGPGGRVFAHTMNGTGTVCGDQWDDSDADVVCRQMGFASGTAIQLPHDYMYNYHIFNVRCFGNESQVQQCPVDETDVFGSCSNHMFGDAGVSCANVTAGPPVSMSFAPDGRVLVHNMNGTGTVCGDMWDDVDAGVLCRQLGFPSGTASLLPRDPVFNRFYFNVNCVGHEIDVQSCPVSNYDIHGTCGYFEDAGVVCDGMPGGGQSDVTIGPGGRVFAHTMNGTGTVCGDQWDDSDADVVCRQMGFASGTAIQLPRDHMYNHHIFNVRCFGNESQVQQCPVDETDVFGSCSNHMFGDAGVSCANVTAGPPVSMSFAPDGRVLVHNMNGTGTVCGDMWDDVDAGVLCRQLGFPSGTASLLPRDPVFNRFYFNVNCVGHEIDVQSCPVSNYDIHGTCGYFEDAGVVCDGMPGGGQSDVTIGPGGRVFAHTMNGTGTVCGDQWDDSDADVVCRQMGFASGTAIQLPHDYMYNYHIFNVRCFGNESQVQQCPVDETDVFGSCSNHMFGDAGVSCANVTAGPPVSMSFAPDGRVLVHNMNGTGTVCGDMWDDVDAGVLCRQLGFPSGTASLLPRDPVFNRFYFNVNCVGHEIDVQSCPVSNYDIHGTCGYFEDAGVVCDGMPGGGQSDVTIGPGGRVFAHTMNGTGTVCGDQWDDSDADVVCRQMGFASGTAIQLPRDHMYNHHIFNVRCFGNESQVQQCPVDETDVFGSCSMFGDAGVSCSNGSIDLVNMVYIGQDGRVMATHNITGYTGTVCGYLWDDLDADVLCQQFGFPSGIAKHMPRDYTYNRAIFNVQCTGMEPEVYDCPVEHSDISGNCPMAGDAGVICENMTLPYPSSSSQYSLHSSYSYNPTMASSYNHYSMSSQYSQYPSVSSQYSQYLSMSSQYSQYPSMSSQYPSMSSQYTQYPSMSSQYSQYPSMSSQYTQFASMSSQYTQYPSMSSQYSQYPSMSSQYSQYPSMSSQYSQYPSMSSQYSQYPSMSSQHSQNPSMSSQYTQYPSMSSQYSQYPSMSSQYSQYPSMSSQYSQYPSMSSQYSQHPSMSSQYTQYPSMSSQYSLYPSMSSQYSQYPSMSSQYSQYPSMSSQYSQYPSMSSQYSQHPSMSSQYTQYPSMSSQYSQYPSVSSQYSLYPSMSSQYSQYPSMSSQYSQYPSMSSQYSQYPSMSSQYSQHPSMSSQYTQYPSMSSQYSQYPSMSSQYSQHPSVSSQYTQYPSMSSQYSQYTSMSSQYSQYPSMSSQYSQHPSMSSQFTQYPSMSSQYSQYPSMSSQYTQYPLMSSQYSQYPSMSSQYTQYSSMSSQYTLVSSYSSQNYLSSQFSHYPSFSSSILHSSFSTQYPPMSSVSSQFSSTSSVVISSQVPASQTTQFTPGQTTTQQATTQTPHTTTQVAAGQTTTQASAGQTTTQTPQTTTQASAGQTTTQAPQTTQASAGQTTTQTPQTTTQASAGQTTTQTPQITTQASAGQTTMQTPQTTTQASAGQTTTQTPQTTTQASAGQTTTQTPQTTTQASAGQTTTQTPQTTTQASAGQTTTQTPQTTTQASAGQTTTQGSAGQTTDQTTSVNCQPGSGSCFLQMDSLGGGAESRMVSHLMYVMFSAFASILCLILMY